SLLCRSCPRAPRTLHSFPTRRSSDLVVGRLLFGITRPRNPIPGTNFAGTVIQVGEKVTRFSPGDRVFGASDHSAYAELLAVSEKDRKSTRLNSSHVKISYAVFCLKKK